MGKAAKVLQDWMLPGAIVLGISLYFIYRSLPVLHPYGPRLHVAASEAQRLVIALLLFFQFVKTSPHDLRFRRWHLWALLSGPWLPWWLSARKGKCVSCWSARCYV